MIAAARRASSKLKIFEHYLFYPPYVKAKELLNQGAIGEATCLRLKLTVGDERFSNLTEQRENWGSDPAKAGRGGFMDGCYHQIATARYYLGEISSVFAWIENLGAGETPAMVLMRHQWARFLCYHGGFQDLIYYVLCRNVYHKFLSLYDVLVSVVSRTTAKGKRFHRAGSHEIRFQR
jgi:predicted dehydrogenase